MSIINITKLTSIELIQISGGKKKLNPKIKSEANRTVTVFEWMLIAELLHFGLDATEKLVHSLPDGSFKNNMENFLNLTPVNIVSGIIFLVATIGVGSRIVSQLSS